MLKWREARCSKGILVASDAKQEWLLPWWWDKYSKYNSFPVTFVDLGLSNEGRDFCLQKGELIALPFCSLGEKQEVELEQGLRWEESYESSTWWEKRVFWHKKPLALLQSPYQSTLWLDTDCEVLASLSSLLDQIERSEKLFLCPETKEAQDLDKEKGNLFPDEVLYNSGVIGFAHGSEYVLEWAYQTIQQHGKFFGDQNLLSRLIYEKNWPVQILDSLYNWQELTQGKNPNVKISHWLGDKGKFFVSMKKLHFLS